MRIRYIFGRSGRGKTNLIFDEIKRSLEENKERKLILIVPEQFTLQAELDLINRIDRAGIMSVEVLSFQRLAYKVFNEVGGLKRIGINELGKLMIFRRLFEEYSKELEVYQKSFNKDGFLINFSNLITEFKKNDISPELLQESLLTIDENPVLQKKLEDIIFIYGKFNEYMKGKYTDEEDKNNLLVELLEQAKFLENAEIWVDGFNGFSEQEYRIIEKLLLKSTKLNIALTLDDLTERVRDKELFEPTEKTLKKLREMASRNNIKETKTFLKKSLNFKNKELEHIESEIYSYPSIPYEGEVNNIELFAALNQYTEIERVANKIIELVRDKGYRWKDIALVNNSMEAYGLTIRRVFTEYGIPYFIDEKRDIMNNPIIKLILASLDIISRNYKYEDLFKFIKTGFCDISKDESEILENYVLKFGVHGTKWFEEFKYGEDDDLSEVNRIREEVIKPFIFLNERLKGKNSVKYISSTLFEFLEFMGVEEKLDSWVKALREQGKIEYANENTQIWNIIIEVFDQLVEILGDNNLTLKEYSKVLESGFSEFKIGIIPPTIDQVLVGNLERSRSHDIKALFVVGVNDGILPSGFSDEGLLLDDEKIIIKDQGVPIMSDCETQLSNEKISIYSAFAKPTEYLWVSYALSDLEGKALRPSILIDRIKKLFNNIKVTSDVTKEFIDKLQLISRPLPTFKYLIESLRLKTDGHATDEVWEEVYWWYYSNPEWKKTLGMMIEGLFHNNQIIRIGEDEAKKLYNTPLKSSISRLERFVNCPFSHFINYGLKPEERKEFKIGNPDIGRLFHDSMEKFSNELSLKELDWSSLDREKSDEIVEKIIDEITPEFQNNILQSSHRYKYLINRLKRVSKRAAWTLTEHIKSGDFIPVHHELGFGEGPHNDIPPIIIELPDGEQIILEGRIDRIDILEGDEGTHIRVIDYKSGTKKFNLSDVFHGLQIQLIVYLDSVLENKDSLKFKDIHPAGVFYFKLNDPLIETSQTDTEHIEKEIMKQLKMDGLVTRDINIAKIMDKSLEEEKNSSIIPVVLKNDGDFGKNSSVLPEEDIMLLIKHIRNLIVEIAGEILKGKVKIEPCKVNNNTPCEYCNFHSICQFDRNFEDNNYRIIKKLKDEEVIGKIKKENGADKNATVD